ncbi:MAG: hypothetical protein P9M03_01040 [Candidatus Theseobacter exili]|nr:hypothetical protein [Candidatus Theseobacter exili]
MGKIEKENKLRLFMKQNSSKKWDECENPEPEDTPESQKTEGFVPFYDALRQVGVNEIKIVTKLPWYKVLLYKITGREIPLPIEEGWVDQMEKQEKEFIEEQKKPKEPIPGWNKIDHIDG